MDFYHFILGCECPGADDASSFAELLADVEAAERGGFSGCFVAEHHNDRPHCLASTPGMLLAHAAARTTRLRLGTMVTILGIRHPYFVAEEIATLDVLSGGRAEYGFGAGGPRWWRQVGIDHKEAGDRLDEAIPLVQSFLAGSGADQPEISYEGRFWSGTGARVVPAVVQRPTPPLWLSGHSPSTVERAGRLGINFCTGFVSCDEVRRRRAAYRETWSSVPGRGEPGRVGHMILAAVGDSRSEIDDLIVPAMKHKLHEFARLTLGKWSDPDFTFERALRERYDVSSFEELSERGIVVYGSSEECTDRIGRISDEAGDALLIQTRFGELDAGFARESIRRLAEEILPRVTGALV